MAQFMIGSHGSLAGGVVSALELLFGKRDNISFINAYLDDASPAEKLKEWLERMPEDAQCIMFADIFGGSVHQEMVKLMADPRVELIAGYNLATVLEFVIEDKERYTADDIRRILAQGREQLVYVERMVSTEQEEDFF